jgi:hypothetical protein
MAGIKSAIELAMERTKGLVMDEEEKKSLALKETEKKVKAVLRRYREGIIESDGLNREIAKIEGDEKLKKSILIDLLIEGLDIKSRNERFFELLSITGAGLKEPFRHEIEMMRKRFLEEMDKRETKIREKITDHMKEMGITGSGVEPNIREWDEWNDGVEDAGRTFRQHITEWKDRLKAANGWQQIVNL